MTSISINFPQYFGNSFFSVSNIAALRLVQTKTIENNTTVIIDGSVSAGDGFAAFYIWSATSTATDDNATVIQPIGIAVGRWLSIAAGGSTVYAPVASPALTGIPSAPTAANATNTTQLATTAFVNNQISAGSFATTSYVNSQISAGSFATTSYVNSQISAGSFASNSYVNSQIAAGAFAPLASPALTGTPSAPTATTSTNTTQIATTAFVNAVVASGSFATTSYVNSQITAGSFATVAYVDAQVLAGGGGGSNAPIASPTFTGIPAAPTASSGTATTQLATTAFVDRLRDIPVNVQTTGYTLALSDRGTMVSLTSGAGFTIPANSSVAFPIGSTIVLFNNNAASATGIVITSDTLRQAGTTNSGPRTITAYGQATIVKVDTTVWTISGVGLI
jgi:hypothetical protein